MRYFLDTEFIEDGKTIELISIGITAEDGRLFYEESAEFDESKANDFVRAHVLPRLGDPRKRVSRATIRNYLVDFIGEDPRPEFWANYAAYDWVVVCQLFGTMMDLPNHWPMFCRDLQQLIGGNDATLPYLHDAHNALVDAKWLRDAYYEAAKIKVRDS